MNPYSSPNVKSKKGCNTYIKFVDYLINSSFTKENMDSAKNVYRTAGIHGGMTTYRLGTDE